MSSSIPSKSDESAGTAGTTLSYDSATSVSADEGGMGGGMDAKDDLAVKIADFAQVGGVSGHGSREAEGNGDRTPSPPSRVATPRTKQDWDLFMDDYSQGRVHAVGDFALERRCSSSTAPTAIPHHLSPQLQPFPTRQTSNIPLALTSSPLNLKGQGAFASNSRTPSPQNSSDEGEFKDSHRITSSSGQANQDPGIPNIPGHAAQHEANWNRQEARRETIPQADGQMLTREHMDRLGVEQKAAAEEADGEGSAAENCEKRRPEGSARTKRVKRARRPMDAELNAERPAHSMASSSSSEDIEIGTSSRGSKTSRKSRPPLPPPRRSHRGEGSVRQTEVLPIEAMLAESGSNSGGSAANLDIEFDYAEDRDRVREFFDKHGYMPAPRQAPDAIRRRLRVIRRLGLERPDEVHRTTLDRFTRLAVSIFKTKRALVSIVGRDRQIFLSEIGMGAKSTSFEDAFCCHTIIGSGDACMVVPNAANDWRFAKNPLVKEGGGIVQFYAGAPLRVGKGPKPAIIGSMCIIDDAPRYDFDEKGKRLLADLAECAVSELELLYNQQATVEAAKLHQISVDFLRRSLKHRPTERAGQSRNAQTTTATTTDMTGSTTDSGSAGKRNSGADSKQLEDDIDIFDEACQEIRFALAAHAVAIVDLSQFHLFYPSYQTSTAGGSRSGGGSQSYTHSRAQTPRPGQSSRSYTASKAEVDGDEAEPYQKAPDGRAARRTYAVVDPMSAGRTPQVLFVPSSGTTTGRSSEKVPRADAANNLPILGYSCNEDNFAFNFSATPAGRKIVCDFIARNVKGRTVWYSRDDSEGVAESITHLMPPGTEASLAMPVFGYDGQVAFAVVGCWTDPLFSYPAGALQFVETIAGSLLASVMKERLHQAERAQLNFAAAASHELRTPLHQLNAAAALLRQALHASLASPSNSPKTSPALSYGSQTPHPDPISAATQPASAHSPRHPSRLSREDRRDAAAQLEIIESNGEALGQILENIIDTLDIGRAISTGRANESTQTPSLPVVPEEMHNLSDVLESVVKDAIMQESKSRRVAGEKGLEDVEILLEVMPRLRGRWILATDPGPLSRALSKIVNNACKFTDKGYIHITVQDMSRDVALPGGYDNSIKLSQVVMDIKDTGRGMSPEFLDQTILRPFAKADPFMPGAGLGLNLAQRMIEILGGKLAIKSTLGKGTLVHIELPLHLINTDNESDLDDMIRQSDHYIMRSFSPSRQDGIMLKGFDTADAGLRRLGRTLLRQLKLRFCRVVDQPQFASLIVYPEGQLSEDAIKELVVSARPDVEVISLLSTKQAMSTSHQISAPSLVESTTVAQSGGAPARLDEQIRITYLQRPLFPSVIRRIVRPPRRVEQPNEVYISDVVGGDEAREERAAGGVINLSEEEEDILPSPPSEGEAEEEGEGKTPSITLSDRWSTSSGTGSTGSARGKRPRRLSLTAQSRHDSNLPPTSPNGIIRDLVASPTAAERPHISTHITEPVPLLHDSLARMSLKTLHSDESITVMPPDAAQSAAMKVLVVEDNAVNRRIVVAMLKRTACRYAEAVDGEDAIRQFLSFDPDLCLLDINMPVKDGFQAASEMRKIELKRGGIKRCKIIAVTALSQESSKRKGMLECGIDEWRTKPVSLKTLKDDVERMRE